MSFLVITRNDAEGFVDFDDGLMSKGFAFKNPNATNTCGCGESFSVF